MSVSPQGEEPDFQSDPASNTPQRQSSLIKETARRLGFDRCGIAAAGPIGRADSFGRWLAEGRAGAMGYMHRHQDSRIDVRAWLPWAGSVIVTALNYRQPEPEPRGDGPCGRVAMYARGEDYHVVVREKLEEMVRQIEAGLGRPFRSRVCVDTSAIVEREIAAAAGVGWIGKNTLVLHQSLGSMFFLGEIITDLELSPDAPEPDHCGSCTRCLDACPTDAFPSPYEMDARRCISYLTIENRGDIVPKLAEKMDDWVFGCDVCQTVCPFNDRQDAATEPRLKGAAERAAPLLDDILSWEQTDYRAAVKGRSTDRAKLPMWKRNAEIARRNLRRS